MFYSPFQCFLRLTSGNVTSTIQYKYTVRQKQAFKSGVPTVKGLKALNHARAAMFMRSTHGCGTLTGLSLEWEGYLS